MSCFALMAAKKKCGGVCGKKEENMKTTKQFLMRHCLLKCHCPFPLPSAVVLIAAAMSWWLERCNCRAKHMAEVREAGLERGKVVHHVHGARQPEARRYIPVEHPVVRRLAMVLLDGETNSLFSDKQLDHGR